MKKNVTLRLKGISMDIELITGIAGRKKRIWAEFLKKMDLEADENVQSTVLVWEDGELIATGSRQDHILKCIAIDPMHQGEDLTATLLTQLRQDAFQAGHRHLFLYTKPKNKFLFSSLFFYPVAQTDQVLLMEDRSQGVKNYVNQLEAPVTTGKIGAAVMNCNPFTLGHQYLIETAASQCDHLYIFVLSEDRSQFSAADRMALVKVGTQHLANVTVLPTGPYLISSATFPTYFLKDRDNVGAVQCQLDIAIFCNYYVPRFGITHRFVGTEPLSAMTDQYNRALLEFLPQKGVEVVCIERKTFDGGPISATTLRSLLGTGQPEQVRKLVPETTFRYLEERGLI